MARLKMLATVVCAVLCVGATSARCDQGSAEPSQADKPTTRQNDSRLPPLLPGEEVVTETGRKMRVWTSVGPVPISATPTAQTINGNGNNNGNGVPAIILDGRDYVRPPGDTLGEHGLRGLGGR